MSASVDPAALRAARIRAGLTQHQLARQVEVAGGEAVARWERGASEPKPATLRRLAHLLGVAPRELLRRDGAEVDLRYLRLAAGVDSAGVATRLHVTMSTYRRWERGSWTVMPSEATLRGLADVFGVASADVAAALRHTRALREPGATNRNEAQADQPG